MENYEVILALILGAFVCLFGYKLKKIVFFIAWFIIGYTLMTHLMPFINDSMPAIRESDLWQFLLPIAGGLLLSLLGFSIEKLCVGLLAFFTTLAVAINQFGISGEVIGIACILGVILGALAVNMMKPATIAITPIAGSFVITDAVLTIFPSIGGRGSLYALLMIVGIAVVGAVFQFTNTKHNS